MSAPKPTKTKTVKNKTLTADSVASHKQTHQDVPHIPVLLNEVISLLKPQVGQSYLDLTAGYGGHAQAIIEHTKARCVLVDRDMSAINYLQTKFASNNQVEIIHSDMLSASRKLSETDNTFDLVLADIGLSSPHVDLGARGFSFKKDGPLDMRMDQSQKQTARHIISEYSEEELSRLIFELGEERKARYLAKKIIERREIKPFEDTKDLADYIASVYPGKRGKIHPATKVFQALRIEVNDELNQLAETLQQVSQNLIAANGKLAVISFHSLEDRIVKKSFKDYSTTIWDDDSDKKTYQLLTKKPIVASKNEIVSNPRARSAKLRVMQRK